MRSVRCVCLCVYLSACVRVCVVRQVRPLLCRKFFLKTHKSVSSDSGLRSSWEESPSSECKAQELPREHPTSFQMALKGGSKAALLPLEAEWKKNNSSDGIQHDGVGLLLLKLLELLQPGVLTCCRHRTEVDLLLIHVDRLGLNSTGQL